MPPHINETTTLPQSVHFVVEQTVIDLLGHTVAPDAAKAAPTPPPRGLEVYDIMTQILRMAPHASFWWGKLGAPFASMLETSHYSIVSQCKFLCYFYQVIVGMMPPYDAPHSGSVMTIDGSPVELSWVLPQSRAKDQTSPRQVRFAIEPMDSISGRRLSASVVLDYLTSPQGSLGLVPSTADCMAWRNKTENFLFPEHEGDEIPCGSRFFIGFDFMPTGMISLKAYYLPAPNSVSLGVSHKSPINLWDVDYTPLRRLISSLEPALIEPLEVLLSYFESLEDRHKPRIQIIAMDCVKSSENRLKIYCRPKEGTSWSDAVRAFTLGGRLQSPQMKESIKHMERLWNDLFPKASSSIDCDLHVAAIAEQELLDLEGNGIKLSKAQHPVGGLLYYYSVFAGKNSVYPKVYLPVTHYCIDDLQICRAVERFYADLEKDHDADHYQRDWVAGEVSKAFNHRPLEARTGIHTYVTFALKKNGWELTNYFSPEV